MGLSKAKCEQVIHKALQGSKHVFCVMQNRYSPPSEWIKSVVDQQLLGGHLHGADQLLLEQRFKVL